MTTYSREEKRANVLRMLLLRGTRLRQEDWGTTFVLDGKVWRVDASSATLLGDYYEYMAKQRQ